MRSAISSISSSFMPRVVTGGVPARLQSFVKTYRFGGDHVHQRSALNARKHSGVNLLGELFFAHDDAAARSAQTFVCGGGDKLRMRNWAGMLTAGHKPGDVRHVDKQNRAY